MQRINKHIASIIHTSNLSIPFQEIIDTEFEKDRFLIQTAVSLNQYTLQVGLLYQQHPNKKDSIVNCKIQIFGIQDPLVKKIAEAIIRKEYKNCRHHEKKLLKQRGY